MERDKWKNLASEMKPKLTGRILRHILEPNKISEPNVALFVYSHVLWSFSEMQILSQIKFILPNNLSFSFPICLLLKWVGGFLRLSPSWDLIVSDTISFHHLHFLLLNHEVMWNIVTDRTWHALSWARCTSWEAYGATSFISGQLEVKTGLFLLFFWGPIYLNYRELFPT